MPSPNISSAVKAAKRKMGDLRLHPIQSAQIPLIYDDVLPIMQRADAYGRGHITAETILIECMAKGMQLWVVGPTPDNLKGAVVTQIIDYPEKRACRYVLVAGWDSHQWLDLSSVIEVWAKERGAEMMEFVGRPGWLRTVKKLGWSSTMRLYEKDL